MLNKILLPFTQTIKRRTGGELGLPGWCAYFYKDNLSACTRSMLASQQICHFAFTENLVEPLQ